MDYKNKLTTRLYLAIGYALIGIAMTITTFIKQIENNFFLSYGIALVGCGIVLMIKNYKLIKNQEKMKMQEIKEKDERNIMIINKARSTTFSLYIMISFILIILFNILNMQQQALMIAYSTCLLLIIYVICYYIFQRKY